MNISEHTTKMAGIQKGNQYKEKKMSCGDPNCTHKQTLKVSKEHTRIMKERERDFGEGLKKQKTDNLKDFQV